MPNPFDVTLRRFQDAAVRQSPALDDLARQAVFGSPEARDQARWLIWEIGQQAGVRPAAIHELYLARGRGEVPPFTTPAMNVRVLAYDTARAAFRAVTAARGSLPELPSWPDPPPRRGRAAHPERVIRRPGASAWRVRRQRTASR